MSDSQGSASGHRMCIVCESCLSTFGPRLFGFRQFTPAFST